MRCRFAMALIAATTWTLCAQAQRPAGDVYPTKPVRVIVGLAPGGATDVQARMFSQRLSEEFGRPFVVDNRSGAGGLIGFQTVAGAAPDGYTLLAATPGFTIAPAFYDKPAYHPVRNFAPISLLTKAPFLVVAHPSFPARSMKELIAFASSKPGALDFGVGGMGTTIHLGAVWIGNATNTKITIVPYKGTGPVLTALLAGEVHTTFANPINAIPLVKAGKLRALAITSSERSRILADVATVAESGIPGFDVTTWHGWLAPRGTPAAIVNRLGALLAKAVTAADTMEKLAADGGDPVGSTPEQFGQFIAAEIARWSKLVKTTGLRLEQ